jgi:hypothetical protein
VKLKKFKEIILFIKLNILAKLTMSECENQSACIDESKIEHYVEKKNNYMKERNNKACSSIAFTLFVTILYYGDIITDLLLCWRYFKDGDIWWFGFTLGIVLFSSLLNTWVLCKYSYFQEFKFNWKKKQYLRIIIKSFCLLFQLEMLCW